MAENLIDTARRYIGPATVKSVGSIISEPPQRTERALDGSISAVFAGFVNEAARDPSRLHGQLSNISSDPDNLARLPDRLANERQAGQLTECGNDLLGKTFRDRLPAVVDHVSTTSGIGRSSARSVLAMAAPIVAGVVGREITSKKLGASELQRLLLGHRPALDSSLGPVGTSLFFGEAPATQRVVTKTIAAEPVAARRERPLETHERPLEKPRDKRSSALWLGLGLMGLLALLGLIGSRGEPALAVAPKVSVPTPRPVDVTPPPAPAKPALPHPMVETPPTPTTPSAPLAEPPSAPPEPAGKAEMAPAPAAPGSVAPLGDGAALNSLVTDPKGSLPQRFVVSGFVFAKDSTASETELNAAADHVAATLKAHPSARIRIDGYTDDRGDPDVNRTLSLERAMAFRKLLIDRGVAPSSVALMGRGAENPLAANTTDDARAENRRIEIVVTRR